MSAFPFPSLDFPGRTTVKVSEIAEKLRFHRRHIFHLIEDGSLPVLDGKRNNANKSSIRVPIEAYRAFVIQRMSTDPKTAQQFLDRAQEIINDQLSLPLK